MFFRLQTRSKLVKFLARRFCFVNLVFQSSQHYDLVHSRGVLVLEWVSNRDMIPVRTCVSLSQMNWHPSWILQQGKKSF